MLPPEVRALLKASCREHERRRRRTDMNKALCGKVIGAERILALSAAVVVVVVITLATLLITAAPSTAPAPSDSVGKNTPVMGSGGEHYGERWNDYGHAETPPVMGAESEHYGEGWNNYGHAVDQPNSVR
jgi:hypothetical protein